MLHAQLLPKADSRFPKAASPTVTSILGGYAGRLAVNGVAPFRGREVVATPEGAVEISRPHAEAGRDVLGKVLAAVRALRTEAADQPGRMLH